MVFDYNIESAGFRKRISRLEQKFFGFRKGKFQRNRKGKWMVMIYDKRKKKEYVLVERYLTKRGAEDRMKEIYKNGEW